MILFPKYVTSVKMRETLLVLVLCFCAENICGVKGQDCTFDQGTIYINDTKIGVELANIVVPSTAQYESFYVQDTGSTVDTTVAKKYFEFEQVDDTHLSFKTTADFGDLGIDADSNGEGLIVMNLYVSLKCGDNTYPSPLIVAISCSFNNEPTFSSTAYSYSVPIPIMQKSDITVYGNEITVQDSNFANTAMTFTIVPDDFEIIASKIDNKHFKAVFSAKKILQFDEVQTYTLTAENTGKKNTSVEITMAPDAKTSIDSPSFKESYYYYDYDGEGSMTPSNGDIVIDTNKVDEAILKLDGELYADNFKISFDHNSKTLYLSSDGNLPLDVPAQIILSLSFTTDSTAKTALLINIAPVVPKFSKKYYSGTYDADLDEIAWAEEIGIEDATSVVIIEQSSLFSIDQTTYKITPKTLLVQSDFDENLNIIFTVVATSSTTTTSEAAVVISLKTKTADVLEFTSTYYTGTYVQENGKWVVNLDSDIGFSDISNLSDIKIQVDESYSSNFKVVQDSSKWKVSISSPLSNDVLNDNRKLAIPLMASKTGLEATAVLILTLPDKVEINFGNLYYSASYVQGTNNKDTVLLNEEIIITGAEAGKVTVIVEEYQEYLQLDHDSGSSYKLTVKKKLNSTALNHKSPLLITIAASTETSVAYTTLVLDLPDQSPQLEFEKPFYHATYSDDKIVLDDPSIKLIKTDYLNVKLSCEGYDDNFELTKGSTDDSYTIKVKTPINDTSISQLSIVITAFDTEADISASTVLVITIPQDSQALRFAEPYYSATYSVVGSKGVVILNEDIKLIGADDSAVSFYVNDYDDYFKIDYTNVESAYTISVKKELNSTALNYKSPLLIIISASTETSIAYTTLVLDLPQQSQELKFEKPFYHATYSIDDKNIVLDDGGMKIINPNNLKVQFSCEGYENSLDVHEDSVSGTYTITVKNPLDEAAVYLNSQLNIVIMALSSDSSISAFTVVVLDLPNMGAFSKDHYSAEYQLSSDGVTHFIGETIKVMSSIFTQISFIGYESNFKATCNTTNECSVTVEDNLNSTILNENDELVINLAAINEDSSSIKTAVLVLKLPSKSFGKDIYSGTYSVDGNSNGNIKDVGDITVNNIDTSLVEVKLKDYGEYFSLKLSDTKWTIEVTNPLPPTITSKQETLVTSLLAVRTTDEKTLAISTLQILLPQNIPEFKKLTYYGTYENSVDPEVVLEEKISLSADSVAASNIFIDPQDKYHEYFDLSESKKELVLIKPLSEDILDNVTSIALTLKAESVEGTYGHTTIVILLPKKLRDSSVEVENQQVLFSGKYQNGSLKSPSITLNTNATTDGDILVEISNDLGLDTSLYFSYRYSNQVLTIITITELPEDFLKNNSVLPLKLAIKDKTTKDTVYAVLNVDISGSSSDDPAGSDKGARTGLIVAVSILAALLLLVLLAAFLFWFFKLREKNKVDITPEEAFAPTKTNTFTKNEAKKQVMLSNAIRRPTGIAIGLSPISQEESLTEYTEPSNPVEAEHEKKVAFNENIEKIDNENDGDDEDLEEMQSVADRRPTKFVFGYPMELGVLNLPDENINSPEYIDTDNVNVKSPDFSNGVKKKGVAFDQNVERIDIETEEGQESDAENSENQFTNNIIK